MNRRVRLVLLALGLLLGWLATPFAPALDGLSAGHGTAIAAEAMPCGDHDATACPPPPRHAEGGAACATPAGCPVLVAVAPAILSAAPITPPPQPPPPCLALPDGRVLPPEPPPPRAG